MKTEIKCCRYVLSLEFRKTMCDPINTSPTICREMCVLYVSGGNISCVLLLIRALLHFTEYITAAHAATYTYVQEHWLRIRKPNFDHSVKKRDLHTVFTATKFSDRYFFLNILSIV